MNTAPRCDTSLSIRIPRAVRRQLEQVARLEQTKPSHIARRLIVRGLLLDRLPGPAPEVKP